MFKNLNFDFIGKKKIFFGISIGLISLIVLTSIFFGVKMSIQFKGGSIMSYSYTATINEKDIKDIVKETINSDCAVTFKSGINGADSFDITLTDSNGVNADSQLKLADKLQEVYGEEIELLENQSTDPILGKEFFMKSIVAVLFAAVILIIYIGFRFKRISGWSAGVMAVLALVHDVIIVFGVFVLFRMPIDYNFIAVVLTILGYSINDTIVIYDRIRENKSRNKNMPVKELVNKSISESMGRTINTTITTMVSMVVISIVALVSGLTSILSFSFPLLIGLISGTYSTVFIAGPLWVTWQEHKAKKAKLAKK